MSEIEAIKERCSECGAWMFLVDKKKVCLNPFVDEHPKAWESLQRDFEEYNLIWSVE